MSADTHATAPSDKDARLTEALARFKFAADAEAEQRERELEALKFVDHDEQWPADVKRAREGFQPGGGLPPVPARPCLTINKLRQPVIQTSNEARSARLSLQFAPKGNGASREVAEAFEDIARAVQADSRASLARQWAYDRAIKGGRGAYRILTEYANDGDFDLDITYKRILNQSSVYLDPSAQEPDWSDGEWAFVVEDVPLARFKRQFPKSKLTTAGDDEPGILESVGDEQPDWVQDGPEGTGKVIRVAEYFYVEYERTAIGRFVSPDGAERTLPLDEAPEGVEPVEKREVMARTVKWCKLTAYEILEDGEWPGRYIPIIPVIADESNINGERRWTGIVEPAMDAQRSYNYMRSAQVEGVGLAPRAPWIGTREQFEGYEAMWAQSNTRNLAYLMYNAARDGSGAALPQPTRSVVEPAIQAITLAAHEADSDIKATTGRFDPSLGNLSAGERSGRAIQALQKQAEQGSSGYLDNLANMSMVYEGKILRDLIPAIYSRPGRVIACIGADEQRRSVMVGKPFMPGKGGLPEEVPEGTPGAKLLDLSAGEYSVAVTIGKSFTTRREESVAAMGQLAEAAPQMMPSIADLWVKNMDFPGAMQIADRLKKMLPPQLQEQEDGQPQIPPQVQAQMQQLAEMNKLLADELKAKTEVIQRDLAKEAAETDRARMEIESKQAIAALNSQTQIELERLKQQGAAMAAQMSANVELERFRLEQLQAYNAQLMTQAHDAEMQQAGADQDRQAAAQQADQQAALQAQSAEQQAVLAQQQAELAPQPEAGA